MLYQYTLQHRKVPELLSRILFSFIICSSEGKLFSIFYFELCPNWWRLPKIAKLLTAILSNSWMACLSRHLSASVLV